MTPPRGPAGPGTTRGVVGVPVERVLDLARTQLGMDVAWLSDFRDGRQVITAATGDLSLLGLEVGDRTDLARTYCVRVVAGTLPPVIPDARRDPRTRDLAVTADLGIGAYVGSAVTRPDGSAVGMLCCLSRTPKPNLDARASRLLAGLVDLIAAADPPRIDEDEGRREAMATLRRLRERAVRPVFQPVIDLVTARTVGYEALARFDGPPPNDPVSAFADARHAGLGVELELLCLQQTFHHLERIPPTQWLSVNCSPDALLDDRVRTLLLDQPTERVVVELTEHIPVSDYDVLTDTLAELRECGVRLSVDDAGAGYASLRHILLLRPDMIKLDIYLTRDIDADPVRRALASSLVSFARSLGASLIAEGVETTSERERLSALGVDLGQGYLLGRPAPLP